MKYFLVFLLIFFSACAKESTSLKTSTAKVIFKSQNIKFKGSSFINEYKKNYILDVYSSSKAIAKIKINNKYICFNDKCYLKHSFNLYFFKYNFYDELLEDILKCNSIFYKKNITYNEKDFVQKIKVDNTYLDFKKEKNTCEFSFKDIYIKMIY